MGQIHRFGPLRCVVGGREEILQPVTWGDLAHGMLLVELMNRQALASALLPAWLYKERRYRIGPAADSARAEY